MLGASLNVEKEAGNQGVTFGSWLPFDAQLTKVAQP